MSEKRDNSIPIVGEELLWLSTAMVANAKFHFETSEDRDDAIQDLCLVGLNCLKKAKEGLPIRSYQVSSMRGTLLKFCRDRWKQISRETRIDDKEHLENCSYKPNAHKNTNNTLYVEMQDAVQKCLASLDVRMQTVVQRCILNGDTLEAVGNDLNVSKEYVRQLVDKAKIILRKRLSSFQEFAA